MSPGERHHLPNCKCWKLGLGALGSELLLTLTELPYDRFFAPASTTSSTKAEEAEAAEAAEAAVPGSPPHVPTPVAWMRDPQVPSTSSRQNQREEEDNWMPSSQKARDGCACRALGLASEAQSCAFQHGLRPLAPRGRPVLAHGLSVWVALAPKCGGTGAAGNRAA